MSMEFRADQTSDSSAWSKPEETGIKGASYSSEHGNPEAWRYQQRLDFAALLEAKPEQLQSEHNVTQGDSPACLMKESKESKEKSPDSGFGETIPVDQRQKTSEKREHSVLVDHPGSSTVDGEEINREPFKNRNREDEYRMSKEQLSVTTVQALINEQSQHYAVASNSSTTSTTLDSAMKGEPVGWQGLEKMFEAQVDKLLINARQTSWDPTETVRLQLKEQFLPGTTLSLQQCSPGCWRLLANCRQAEIRDMLQKAIPGLQSRFRDKQLGELNIVEVVLDSEPGDELW